LRERLEDVPDLVHNFLQSAKKTGLPYKTVQPEALERLKRYSWPGNVRELENLVRRLTALYSQETITADIIETELASSQPARIDAVDNKTGSLTEWMENYLTDYFTGYGETLPPPGLYDRILRDVESPLITAALAATRGNQIRAAELLGLNRNTLRKKIKDHKIRIIRAPV
jgi:two-component system nitrogen regulation response regulator GlnG